MTDESGQEQTDLIVGEEIYKKLDKLQFTLIDFDEDENKTKNRLKLAEEQHSKVSEEKTASLIYSISKYFDLKCVKLLFC